MPNNLYPHNMIKRKKSYFSAILSILVIIISICLSITSAMLLSDFITVGSLSFEKIDNIKKNSYTIYAVSLYQTTIKSNAQSYSDNIISKGGAGYIKYSNGNYYVLTSGYKEQNDAENVITKLSNQGITANLLEINIPSISFSEQYTPSQSSVLNSAINCFSNSFDSLYDMSVALDTNISTESDIYNQLSSLLSTQNQINNEFNKTFSNQLTSKLIQIKIALMSIIEITEDLLDKKNTTTPLSSSIKHCYFEIIDKQLDLYSTINSN